MTDATTAAAASEEGEEAEGEDDASYASVQGDINSAMKMITIILVTLAIFH